MNWVIPPPSNCPYRGLIKGVLVTPITHCGNSYSSGEMTAGMKMKHEF